MNNYSLGLKLGKLSKEIIEIEFCRKYNSKLTISNDSEKGG